MRDLVTTVVELAGATAIIAGIWLFSPRVGLIFAGVAAVLVAYAASEGRP